MKWLKTTAYNNLSRNLTENRPPPPPSLAILLTSMKHKKIFVRGHQWPFYHLKIHKLSFLMVSESVLGYLIPGLTQISSISLILYNLPVILRRHKRLHYERKSFALIITNKMIYYFRGTKYEFFRPPYQLTFFLVFGQPANQRRFF